MTISGKLELTIKINTLPDSQTVDNGWKSFNINCDGKIITITVRPKLWNKLEQANANFPQWVATIGGLMGASTKDGFVLEQPNIQVFERKAKTDNPEGNEPMLSSAKPSVAAKPKPEQVFARPGHSKS